MKNKLIEFMKVEKGRLLHYIRKNIGNIYDYDAEDILQDVFLKITEMDMTSQIENLAGYIYKSIKNRIIDIYRKPLKNISMNETGNTNYTSMEEILTDTRYDVVDELNKKDIMERIMHAIEKLNPAYKRIFIETEINGHSFSELSKMWNQPMGTLLSQKHRALNILQKELKYLEDKG
jgi:RNA polymerase sigma factor (sigma-70 family)